jgi:MvaI/BcnI restriction endonuclease family
MTLNNLKNIFHDNGCEKIYIKTLSPNDNSKNQVYFAGSFEVLNILPVTNIISVEAGEWKKERFKAKLDFSWIGADGQLFHAPGAQLILYPKYPEVRFSGFLQQCPNAPSDLMTVRLAGRLFFFGVTRVGKVIGYVAAPDSEITTEFNQQNTLVEFGVFRVLKAAILLNDKEKLLAELLRIHQSGWIRSKRLDRHGGIVSCEAPNCGGYTLEAELGIIPNGYSEPDYLGWEIKQFGVTNFGRVNSAIITLMTPEPTGGIYRHEGADTFIRKYGYADKNGREDRMNFGGIHKVNTLHPLTKLTMQLEGFDSASGKIRNSAGKIALLDGGGNEAASWDFSSMLMHWNRKHNQACYVPSLNKKENFRQYSYGNQIILGRSTDFQLFLAQMAEGNIYYDPGIKMENASTAHPAIKKRSQFRIKSQFLPALYRVNEVVDISIE